MYSVLDLLNNKISDFSAFHQISILTLTPLLVSSTKTILFTKEFFFFFFFLISNKISLKKENDTQVHRGYAGGTIKSEHYKNQENPK